MTKEMEEFIRRLERLCEKHEWWDGNVTNSVKSQTKRDLCADFRRIINEEKKKNGAKAHRP